MSPEKVYQMDFNRVYPLLVAKAERKGRTQEEVDEIICWLTGYSQEQIQDMQKHRSPTRTFSSRRRT